LNSAFTLGSIHGGQAKVPASGRLSSRVRGWYSSRVLKDLVIGKKAALVAALSLTGLAFVVTLWWQSGRVGDVLVTEAVNDHLRVLYAERPLEIENGNIPELRTWFGGRLDFAPALEFAGNPDFPLQGAAVAYFVDRKAAAFVFKRGQQLVTLLVFRASDLPWALRGDAALGRVTASKARMRGFNVLLWRDADLGYALTSDLAEAELTQLAKKITAAPPR
jgi:anti-sigma factor RsiW